MCRGVKDATVTPGWIGALRAVDDHPLLWDFTDDLGYLTFSSAPNTPEAVIVRLYEVHLKVCSHWRPFSKYVNHLPRNGLIPLLTGGMGMLAQGPLQVVRAYQEAVDGLLETSLVKHDLTQKPVLKAILLEESFVVAEAFDASEVLAG